MLPRSIEDLLGMSDDTQEAIENLTAERAVELLALGANPNGLRVGDAVERTELGKSAVRFPADETNQMAKIIAVYPDYREHAESGVFYNGLVDIALADDTIKTFPADLRHYQKVSTN